MHKGDDKTLGLDPSFMRKLDKGDVDFRSLGSGKSNKTIHGELKLWKWALGKKLLLVIISSVKTTIKLKHVAWTLELLCHPFIDPLILQTVDIVKMSKHVESLLELVLMPWGLKIRLENHFGFGFSGSLTFSILRSDKSRTQANNGMQKKRKPSDTVKICSIIVEANRHSF